MRNFLAAVILICNPFLAHAYLPKSGVIPNKDVAVKVAEVILAEVYGSQVLEQRPFAATLKNGVWSVEGTFHCAQEGHCFGGTTHIEIQKTDGRVVHIEHGK